MFGDIKIQLDTVNEFVPPIRIHAGDIDGRRLVFVVTNNGQAFGTDTGASTQWSGQLQWNADPNNPNSAGGFTDLTVGSETLSTGDETITFTGRVPRALLNTTASSVILSFVLTESSGTLPHHPTLSVICTRNFTAFIEPSVLKATAPDIADPLKALHDAANTAQDAAANAQKAVSDAQSVIDGASISAGTTTTLKPNQAASSELSGTGLTRTLNLGIPRGAGIASITATTATGSTPTVATDKNADGDLTVSLGIPRGEKGDPGSPGAPGPKGDPGDASTIASSTVAGVVKVGSGLAISDDGTLSATAQDQPPATDTTLGIVVPSSGLMVSQEGALSVRAGKGLTIDPNDNAAVAVKFGAGLGLSSDRTLIASGTTVLTAASEDGSLFGKITCPSPTAPTFFFECWGKVPAEATALDFGDAIRVSVGQNPGWTILIADGVSSEITRGIIASSRTTNSTKIFVTAISGSQGKTFSLLMPISVHNDAPSAASAKLAAADDATTPAGLSCTIDWSRLK